MATFEKIPDEAKTIGAIAIGPYAIFCKGLLKAATVAEKLKSEEKKGIPAVGFVKVKGEKIYYCRYGFLNDPDIYE